MVKNYFFFFLLFILLNIFNFSFSNIFPVKKIIFTNNIYKLNIPQTIQWNLESQGYAISFNDKSNISLIPYNLMLDLYNYFYADEEIGSTIRKHKNGTEELIINANIYSDDYETIHFILENIGIIIPVKYFYIEKGFQEYGIRFYSKENQEYIEFGKDLIDIMKIEFKDDNDFVIHNEEFLIKTVD